jgi:hypothetical protein
MAKSISNLNPQLSPLDDGPTLRQLAKAAQHALEMADRLKEPHYATPEQIEAERFQAQSNALAEESALYAAARSAAANFSVVPLEPMGTSPLLDPKAATNDARLLLKWWQEWPEANPGVALGRVAGLWSLYVEDHAALERLRALAAVEMRDDNDKTWTEYREIGGAAVRLFASTPPFSVRRRGGWGRDYTRGVAEMVQEDRQRQPQTAFVVYSYPSVVSGLDAFDYRARTIGQGLRVMGEGETLVWSGSILEGGIRVTAPSSQPPTAPLWLSKVVGKPRSRKAMAAQREQWEADLRIQNARAIAVEAQLRILENDVLERAAKDRQQAEKVLADELSKG